MGIFRSDLKRIFTSWIFFLSIVIVVIGGIIQCALIYPDFADHSQTYGPLNCFLAAFCLSGYGPVVAPILAVLPFATAYIDDLQTGYVKSIIARTTRRSYVISRMVSIGISGGLVLLLGIFIYPGVFLPDRSASLCQNHDFGWGVCTSISQLHAAIRTFNIIQRICLWLCLRSFMYGAICHYKQPLYWYHCADLSFPLFIVNCMGITIRYH